MMDDQDSVLQELVGIQKEMQYKLKKDSRLAAEEALDFDSEEVYKSILQALKIRSDLQQEYLLFQNGRCNLNTGEYSMFKVRPEAHEQVNTIRDFPRQSARYQINRRLYVCGGFRSDCSSMHFYSRFFSYDYEGNRHNLAHMETKRGSLSLSGLSQLLIAIGGRNEKSALREAEQYDVKNNRWNKLPQMNRPRRYPGSCLLQSRTAFCFCGVRYFQQAEHINSIQTLSIDEDCKWKLLPVNSKVAQNHHLAAVEFHHTIVLFGGQHTYGGNMHIFNLQGKLLKDLSYDPIIPGTMCAGSVVVQNDKLYAVGLKSFHQKELKWRAQVFDGKKWAFL